MCIQGEVCRGTKFLKDSSFDLTLTLRSIIVKKKKKIKSSYLRRQVAKEKGWQWCWLLVYIEIIAK